MFSVMPVCNQGRGSHVTIPYGALDVNVQVLLAPGLLPAPTLPPSRHGIRGPSGHVTLQSWDMETPQP